MSDTKLLTGRDLGQAICKHFGLDVDAVQSDFRIKTDPNDVASINLTISLTADDLAGIARAAGSTQFSDAETLTLKAEAAAVRVEQRATVAEMVPGEIGEMVPDPRVDEIVELLKRLVAHQENTAAVACVN